MSVDGVPARSVEWSEQGISWLVVRMDVTGDRTGPSSGAQPDLTVTVQFKGSPDNLALAKEVVRSIRFACRPYNDLTDEKCAWRPSAPARTN